jgi:hypothetical protein
MKSFYRILLYGIQLVLAATGGGDGFECSHHVGWFRIERGGATCTLVVVYMSIRLRESQ